MKTMTLNIFGLAIVMLLLIGGAFSESVSGQTKSLVNADALNRLRETGEYESLRAAFDTARKLDGDELSRPEAAQLKLTASDGALGDRFGGSVAISGDTAIVGSFGDSIGMNSSQGSAYIFLKSGATWTQQAKLTAADGAADDFFGGNVAIDGDTAIVGSFFSNIEANPNQGSAYIFVRNGTTWTQQAKLTASDGAADDNFGVTVDINGDTAIIGSFIDDIGANINQGSAYIFVRNGTTWTQQQKLISSDGAVDDIFGSYVAISGDTAIVGSPTDDIGANLDQGSAYIFLRSGTTWTQQQKLTAADGATFDNFGTRVDINGDTAIVGSTGDDVGANGNQGSAYIFLRSGAAWMQQQKLTAADGATNDTFGISVSVDANTAVIGSFLDDVGANFDHGSAYVFVRNGTIWTQREKLIAADSASGDNFGRSVAVSGDTAIVGSFFDDVGMNSDQGSAYAFDLSRRVAFDFDGDGKADLGVFRPSNGGWYIYSLANNSTTGVLFGQTGDVIVPADYDGDGKTDVAVYRGGTWYLNRSQLGFAGIGFGAADDLPAPADFDGDGKAEIAVFRPSTGNWFVYNLATNANSGFSFGQSGDRPVPADYDGDGKADIAVYRAGVWYLLRSALGFTGVTFGEAGDKTVQADYDGDGKADIAVFRPSNGTWYLLQSTAGFTGIQFGLGTDLPVPADYDGDGKTDVAVFRNGTWYVNRSTQGFTGAAFGATNDTPVSNAYVR